MKGSARRRHKIKIKKSIFKKPFFWRIILIFVLVTTGIYFLVFFEKFQISKIIISGNEKVQTENLQKLILQKIEINFWFGVPIGDSRSIFLISPNKIKKNILEQYPNIGSVTIKRELPDTLIINIEERKPFAVFCNDSDCFFIDINGVVFEKTLSQANNFLIVRQNIVRQTGGGGDEKLVLGEEVISKEIIEKIAKIKKGTEERSQVNIKEAKIVSEERLDIKTSEGWEIYFNLTVDIDLQVEKLNLLLEKEIPEEGRVGLQYIDLRFGNRAYYK